ncbi:class I SAM-dependent methyltransferase [Acanthopleuribacter pedis]|uniref:Class I SAM-dependent methyltransferase n=1 Tax=Acanthopleuribacter pedis TaxID=442870 RepID=A0A8J7U3Y0_9BACT|nr:class I SAM-dependent methyltransferase [Acanthopleuribacter pedis]MBO1320913.1 class I SAM-dependent methyltransferase [Acanthopleuribacter pedis]
MTIQAPVAAPEQATCLVCGGPGEHEGRFGDTFYRVTEAEVDLYRCRRCRSDFVWPLPSRAEINDFYPSGYWQEQTGESSLMARAQQVYIQAMLKADLMGWIARLNLAPGAKLIDLGCSRGDWLALIAAAGYQVEGLESDPRAVAFARYTFGLKVSQGDVDDWSPDREGFDAVCLFHLLEHVRSPRGLLTKIHGALKPGGSILLRVPNRHSWQGRLFGKHWKGLEIPRHLCLFEPKALLRLLEEVGFTLDRWSTWSLRDGPPAASSSLFRQGEPTWRLINRRGGGLPVLLYLALTWAAAPWEALAALCGAGSMTTIHARKG